jgi:hypothetical protein
LFGNTAKAAWKKAIMAAASLSLQIGCLRKPICQKATTYGANFTVRSFLPNAMKEMHLLRASAFSLIYGKTIPVILRRQGRVP